MNSHNPSLISRSPRMTQATKRSLAFLGGVALLAAILSPPQSQQMNLAPTESPIAVEEYRALTQDFVDSYQIDLKDGLAVCRPPSGADIYMQASKWKWEPALVLKKGQSYNLHLSSVDITHGFALEGLSLTVVPGSEQILQLQLDQTGEFRIVCDEFCGLGHELMTGTIIVEP